MTLASLLIAFGANTAGFHRGLGKIRDDVGKLDGPLGKMRGGFARAGGAMGSIVGRGRAMVGSLAQVAVKLALVGAVAGGALAGGLGFAVHEAVQFERSMLNVQSIAKVTPAAFEQMKRDVIDLTRTLPQSADELAHGLYDIQSSGFAGAQGITILKAAAKAASAGLASTADSASGIVAVLNAYGLKAKDAAYVSDVLFQVVNRGVITFPELSAEIGKTTAVAAALHVPLRDVAAGIALLTRHGIDGANATTQLNAIMNSILKPTSNASKLAKKLGIDWSTNALKTKGLSGVMAELIKKTGGSADKMAILLGDARAIRGAFVLASGGGKEFRDELGFFNNVAGVTDDVLAVQKQGLGYQLDVLKNNLVAVAITIGTALIPKLLPLVQGLSNWLNANKALVASIIDGVVNGISTLAGWIGTIVVAVSTWVGANQPLINQVISFAQGALATLAGWISTVGTALGGQGGKGGLIATLGNVANTIFTYVVPKVQAFIDTLTKPGGVIDSVMKVAGPVLSALAGAFGSIVGALFGSGGKAGGSYKGGNAASQGLVPALGDLAGVLWGGGKGPLAVAVDAAGKGLAWLANNVIVPLIGHVADLIRTVKDAVEWIGKLNLVTEHTAQDSINYHTGQRPGGSAAGGWIRGGQPRLVGERGPEVIMPESNSMVVPNDKLGLVGGGGGDTYNITINRSTDTSDERDIGRALRRISGLGITGAPRLAGSGA